MNEIKRRACKIKHWIKRVVGAYRRRIAEYRLEEWQDYWGIKDKRRK